jgi:hypothetical protein
MVRLVSATAVVLALTGGAIAWEETPRGVSHALVPPDSADQFRAAPQCGIGDIEYYGLAGFGETGETSIHVTKAEIVGVPVGLTILSVNAVSIDESQRVAIGWASEKDWIDQGYGTMPLHPVSDIVIDPTPVRPNWWILVKVQVAAMGPQSTQGLKLNYTSGGRSGVATYKYEIATACGQPRNK